MSRGTLRVRDLIAKEVAMSLLERGRLLIMGATYGPSADEELGF
jgi:hypothetical protein